MLNKNFTSAHLGEKHLLSGNIEQSLQLNIWTGNICEALRFATENGQLTDWLVSISITGM